MSNLKDLVTNASTDFSSEHSIFTVIPWGDTPTKNVSLIRCIMTIKNVQEAHEVLRALQTEEYKKFVGGMYPTNPTIKLFIEKLIALPDISEPAPLQIWLNLITFLNKDGSFSKTNIIFESIWNRLVTRLSPLIITAHKESQTFHLTTSINFFLCGFKTEVLDSFREKIMGCTTLDEAWKIGSWIKEHFARYENTNTVSQPAFELCEKFIAEYLTREDLTFDDYKKLYDYGATYEAKRPISKESAATITEAIKKFFDKQIASETPWEEVVKMRAPLNMPMNLAYREREIKETSFEGLKPLIEQYKNNWQNAELARLTFLNLLKQEELIQKQIEGIVDIHELDKLRLAIPNDLKYLNAELLAKARVLLGT